MFPWKGLPEGTSDTLLDELRERLVPTLKSGSRKGDAGRIAIVGGCREYTGAPYFSALASLRTGADLAHVFCTPSAALPLKGYSPELILHPVLPDDANATGRTHDTHDLREIATTIARDWFGRLDVLVVGPGLGRQLAVQMTAEALLTMWILCHTGCGPAGSTGGPRPLVLDGDGLQLAINRDEGLGKNDIFVKGSVEAKGCVLTPNPNEYARLLLHRNLDERKLGEEAGVAALANALGGVTIVRKGVEDIISNGEIVLRCVEPGSPRRCGGQGDVLSGVTATFVSWACKSGVSLPLAAYGACLVTRRASRKAFSKYGRGTLAKDVLDQVSWAFDELFPVSSYLDS